MRLTATMRRRIEDLPARPLNGIFHRQTDPKRQPLDLPEKAVRGGRWHTTGDPWPAYASSTPEAAMFELVRGFERDLTTPPPLPTRRMSELVIEELEVVDLANELALEHVGIRRDQLVDGYDFGPETAHCRAIAALVRARPAVLGLLVPSAALPGADVLVLFPAGFRRVRIGSQQLVELMINPLPEPDQAAD